jgi:hypothetical protein
LSNNNNSHNNNNKSKKSEHNNNKKAVKINKFVLLHGFECLSFLRSCDLVASHKYPVCICKIKLASLVIIAPVYSIHQNNEFRGRYQTALDTDEASRGKSKLSFSFKYSFNNA